MASHKPLVAEPVVVALPASQCVERKIVQGMVLPPTFRNSPPSPGCVRAIAASFRFEEAADSLEEAGEYSAARQRHEKALEILRQLPQKDLHVLANEVRMYLASKIGANRAFLHKQSLDRINSILSDSPPSLSIKAKYPVVTAYSVRTEDGGRTGGGVIARPIPKAVATKSYSSPPTGKSNMIRTLERTVHDLSWEVHSWFDKGQSKTPKAVKTDKESKLGFTNSKRSRKIIKAVECVHQVFGAALRCSFMLHNMSQRLDDPTKPGSAAVLDALHFSEALSHDSYCINVKYSFTTYAPIAFRCLRHMLNITDTAYQNSLLKLKGGKLGAGKSGQLFYKSTDGRFVLKTLPRKEAEVLRSILPTYYSHLFAARRDATRIRSAASSAVNYPNIRLGDVGLRSFLARYFGLYSIEISGDKRKIYLVCMENALSERQGIRPTRIFDLKGSTQGRYVLEGKEKIDKNYSRQSDNGDNNPVLKDINWKKSNLRIRLPMQMYSKVEVALKRDVDMLQKLNICDYSLLVGVHSPEGLPHSYFWVSIIDTLQLFNIQKRSERFMKKQVLGQKDVSCEDTLTYARRFSEFATKYVFQGVDVSMPYDMGVQGFEGFT